MEKPAVEVIAHFTNNGDIVPLKIRIEEESGQYGVYSVDYPCKPVRGASLKIGIQGYRYACRIDGKKAYLYRDEENKWFIERV